jgi:signal peptidase II
MKLRRNPMFWLSAIVSLLLDRLSKEWILAHFELTTPPQSWPLWPGVFHITYVANRGAAFSLFQGVSWLGWLSLAVSLALIYHGLFGAPLKSWEQAGYGLLLGGAAGNGVDRLTLGQVTDFLDFRLINFPVFNLADVAINAGLICLFVSLWLRSPQGGKPPSKVDSS